MEPPAAAGLFPVDTTCKTGARVSVRNPHWRRLLKDKLATVLRAELGGPGRSEVNGCAPAVTGELSVVLKQQWAR